MKIKERADGLLKSAVNKMIDIELLGWPPECLGVYHQPERPRVELEDSEEEIKN